MVLGSLSLVYLLAGAGIVAQVRRLAPRAPPFVWAIPLLMVVPAIPVYGLPRYRAPVDPFLVMLAAVGASALWRRARSAG